MITQQTIKLQLRIGGLPVSSQFNTYMQDNLILIDSQAQGSGFSALAAQEQLRRLYAMSEYDLIQLSRIHDAQVAAGQTPKLMLKAPAEAKEEQLQEPAPAKKEKEAVGRYNDHKDAS